MQLVRKFLSVFAALFTAAVLGLGFMPAAQAQSIDQLLANPQVDDIYAGRVDHFSDAQFGNGGAAYGLMRVIRVTNSEIVVITEDAAWPQKPGSLDDLNGDFSDIGWDFDEEITIRRADLPSLKSQDLLYGARRLTAAQIREYLN